MKIARTIGLVLLVTLAFGAFQLSFADDKSELSPEQDTGWFCPWSGQYGMGPGMMWHHGYEGEYQGRGPEGMRGYGPGYGRRNYNRTGQPVTMDQAKVLFENYLTTIGNPNLKGGKITDKDKYFEAEIDTKDDSLVDKLMIDKQTGWMRSIY